MKLRIATALALLVALAALQGAEAAPRLGRAVIAGIEGGAQVETPEGAFDAEEGLALSHGHALVTGGGASVCALLTPGALMCVRENSRVELNVLEHAVEGLPAAGKDTHGRIAMTLDRGAVLLDGLKGPEGLDLDVAIQPEGTLTLLQAQCIVAREKDGFVVFVEKGSVALDLPGGPHAAKEGQTLRIAKPAAGGPWQAQVTDGIGDRTQYDFYVCRELFPALEPLALDWSWENMDGAGDVAADGARIAMVTRSVESLDVSPSIRAEGERRTGVNVPGIAPGGNRDGIRPRVEMWQWYRGVGLMRGFNYLPRTAVNPTEMWQAETFAPDTIDEELGWAQGSGFTSVRVFLPFLVWQADPEGLRQRMDAFLDLADKHDLTVVPVLFDDYSPHGIEPTTGPQGAPAPGVHNSQWTPSPGHARVTDRAVWPELERYVRDIVGAFNDDERILFWDLYNDPGRSGMGDKSLPLATEAFAWARAERPSQPVTAGVNAFLTTPAASEIMKRADVISFSGYESRAELEAGLAMAGLRGRPVICTGWLDRTQGLTYDAVLPLFAAEHVGWYQWGLVAGRSQLEVPSGGGAGGGDVWAQALLKPDGTPWDEKEVQAIRQFVFEEK